MSEVVMNEIVLYSTIIAALVISDVLLVAICLLAFKSRRECSLEQPSKQDSSDEALRQHFTKLATTLGVTNERLTRIESHVESLQQLGARQSIPQHKEADHRAYEVATKMAEEGAEVEQLITLCGLTAGEAELIQRVKKNKAEANKSTFAMSAEMENVA